MKKHKGIIFSSFDYHLKKEMSDVLGLLEGHYGEVFFMGEKDNLGATHRFNKKVLFADKRLTWPRDLSVNIEGKNFIFTSDLRVQKGLFDSIYSCFSNIVKVSDIPPIDGGRDHCKSCPRGF